MTDENPRSNSTEVDNDESKTHLIFSYGTLKQGFPNHGLMHDLIRNQDGVFRGSYIPSEPYPLVCGPYGIPYLIHLPRSNDDHSTHKVKGELYSVSTRGLARLDEFEGIRIGHYERLSVQVQKEKCEGSVEAEAYFAHRSFGEGLWRKKGRVGMSEYTLEEAREYVRKEDRPAGAGENVVENLRSFLCSD